MNGFSFWSNWAKPYKILWMVLLVLFAGSILCFIASMWAGASLVIDWQNIATLEMVQLPLSIWEHPMFSKELQADSYLVKQSFLGSELQVNLWPAYLLLVAVCLALSVALAVISGVPRFWYIAGMALFCGLVVSLRLEQLQLFGRIDKTADVLIFMLFLPLSYYFHALKPEINLIRRAISFLALFILMGGIIHAFSQVGTPFLYIAHYGLPAFIVLSFLTIVLVSPEIIAGILYLVTASNNEHSRNSLQHFMLASLLYLGNLILYYLELRGAIDWGLYTISPFWILLVSLVISIWTLRKRSENLRNIIPYEPSGAFLFLSLALICLATISYVFVTANDPFIETFEDAILYTHLGFGGLFFLYVFANFFVPLKENRRVYQVLYQPPYMPLFTARLAGLIALFGLYSFHGAYAVFQPAGGYYNAIGDLYTVERNYYLAEQYYKLGSQYKYANHRSNYALASLALRVDKPVQAMLFLKEAIERQPTPFAYANLANLYFNNNLFFDGLFTLREGIERYPEETRLYNNLGVHYGKTAVLDSALYYLNVAQQDRVTAEAAVANELAVLAEKRVRLGFDSLALAPEQGDLFYHTNLLALYHINGLSERAPEQLRPEAFQELGGLEAAYLLNYTLLKEQPDSLFSRQLRQLLDSATTSFHQEPATLALALSYYKQQNHYAAYRQLSELAFSSRFNSERYFQLLSNWSLEQKAPQLAYSFLNQVMNPQQPETALMAALALADAGKPLQASEQLRNMPPDSLLSESVRKPKNETLRFLNQQDFSDMRGSRDRAAYMALRLQWGALSPSEEAGLLDQIKDSAWKVRALGWLVQKYLSRQALEKAERYLRELKELAEQEDGFAGERYQELASRLSIYRGALFVPEVMLYGGDLGVLYRQARKATAAGDSLGAMGYYRDIFKATPFFEEAYFSGIPLFNAQGKVDEAYDFLLKGIHFNPYSVQLKKQYILQSLRMGLTDYAEDELLRLQELLDKEEFESFVQGYEALVNQLEERDFNW